VHVRFRVALGVRLAAVLGVFAFRYGDSSMSRGKRGAGRRHYTCPVPDCGGTRSTPKGRAGPPSCPECGTPMVPDGSPSGG